MRRIRCIASFALLLSCVLFCFSIASAQQTLVAEMTNPKISRSESVANQPEPQQGTQQYYCVMQSAADRNKIYFSDNFDGPDGAVAERRVVPILKDGFRKFLVEKYSFPNDDKFWHDATVGCTVARSRADQESRVRNAKQVIVKTGWKYTGRYPAMGP
jgi:hypothetical protein